MNLRQQIVQSNIETTAQLLNVTENEGFLRFAHSLFVDQSIHSFDLNDIVDGGQDKQLDTISIQDFGDEATVYIVQVKNSESFSSNIIIQIRNGLNWLFNKSRKDIESLSNANFKDRILAYRELQS